jgi:hypothetical protein
MVLFSMVLVKCLGREDCGSISFNWMFSQGGALFQWCRGASSSLLFRMARLLHLGDSPMFWSKCKWLLFPVWWLVLCDTSLPSFPIFPEFLSLPTHPTCPSWIWALTLMTKGLPVLHDLPRRTGPIVLQKLLHHHLPFGSIGGFVIND